MCKVSRYYIVDEIYTLDKIAKIIGTDSRTHLTTEKTFCGMDWRASPKFWLKGLLQSCLLKNLATPARLLLHDFERMVLVICSR